MRLEPFTEADIALVGDWLSGRPSPVTEPPDATRPVVAWLIRLDDDTPIGWIEIFNVDEMNRKGEIGVCIYEERGKGLALFAVRMALREGFKLGLNRIYSRIPEGNAMSIKLCEKAGFTHEGTERQAVFRNGRYEDVRVYAKLKGGDVSCPQDLLLQLDPA